jgi:hypothetical protein
VQWAVMDDGPRAEGTASMKVPCMVQWAVMDDAGRAEGDCTLKGGWSRGSQPVHCFGCSNSTMHHTSKAASADWLTLVGVCLCRSVQHLTGGRYGTGRCQYDAALLHTIHPSKFITGGGGCNLMLGPLNGILTLGNAA